MKKLIATIAVLMFTSSIFAAQITFTIPDGKLPRVVDAMKGLYPIPLDGEGQPMFADGPWAKEVLRRWIVSQVQRWEIRKAMDAARQGVAPDDTIAQ